MGIVYSHSIEEEKELMKKMGSKKYTIFHENFLDENGNPTDGSVRQIIFGSEELRKKSINNRFTCPSSNFVFSIEKIKRLVELYPSFVDLYEKVKVKKFRELLQIDNISQQESILKELLREFDLDDSIPDGDLAQLTMIYGLRQSKDLSKLAKLTGENQFSFAPNELDLFMMRQSLDRLYLSREPEFLNEMILIYLTTIFKEYLKSILKEVFVLYPKLYVGSEPARCHPMYTAGDGFNEKNDMPDSPKKLKRILEEIGGFDLKKQGFEWDLIEEKFLRRDVLIHSQGIPDADYKKKTAHTGDSRLLTDIEYVKESIKTFEECHNIIKIFLWQKYGNLKFLEQMRSEDNLE